jgi:hypothetical protein
MYTWCSPCQDRFNYNFRFISACCGPEKAIDGYRRGEDIRQTK